MVPRPGYGARSDAHRGGALSPDSSSHTSGEHLERLGVRLREFARQPHVVPVALISLVFAALYAVAGLIEHQAFRTALLDLGIYDQATRAYANFALPRVPLFGVRTPTDLGLLHWTDHFSPIQVLLAPLYWLYDGPETLLVAEGALFALAIAPLWIFTRRALGTVAAYLVAIAYGLSWPILYAVWTPFHQVAFATPLLALMLERYQAREYRQAAIVAASLMLVREDLGLVIAALGFLLVLRGERKLGSVLIVGGIAAVWLVTNVVMPLMGGSPRRNWSYWQFGRNPFELVLSLISRPLAMLEYALTPAAKVHTLIWLFGALLFLPFASRLVLLAVPLLAVRFLSDEPNHWSMGLHYDAFVWPVLLCAAVDAASRLPSPWRARFPRLPKAGLLCSAAIALFALTHLPRTPGWAMTAKNWWFPYDQVTRTARRALAQVPSGAFVAASNSAGIHLTRRAKVILWVPPGDRRRVEAVWTLRHFHWRYLGDRKLAEAPWVVADTERKQVPFKSIDEQRASVRSLEKQGYKVVFQEAGYVVLHREP